MVYPISPASVPDARGARNRQPLFAHPEQAPTIVQYAISFPFSSSDASRRVRFCPPPGGCAVTPDEYRAALRPCRAYDQPRP